jgi:hypothetical protein
MLLLSVSSYSKRPTHHLATITTSQELTLKTRAQGNRQGRKKFILPKATLKKKEKGPRGDWTRVTTTTGPPPVARLSAKHNELLHGHNTIEMFSTVCLVQTEHCCLSLKNI